jgi:hypothetical protein
MTPIPALALFGLIGIAVLAGPVEAQDKDSAQAREAAYMMEPVLPSKYPHELLRFVGPWAFEFSRSDGAARLTVGVDLVPDSIPRIAEVLQLNHTCYACLGATLDVDWSRLLKLPPSSNRMRMATDTVRMSAIIGRTMQTLVAGDLDLEGHWEGDSVLGSWQQLESPDSAHGTFVLRRTGRKQTQ